MAETVAVSTNAPSRRIWDCLCTGCNRHSQVNSTLLFVLGIGLIHWRQQDLGQVASYWINTLWVSRPYFDRLISKLSSLDRWTVEELAAGSFVYSALLLIEGIGLCRRKRWAEFLTVGITTSLLPFEFYELFQRLTATRTAITLLNVAILLYLLVQLMQDHRRRASNLTKP